MAVVVLIPAVIFPASSETLALPAALALVIAAGITGGWIYGRDSRSRALYAAPFIGENGIAKIELLRDGRSGTPVIAAFNEVKLLRFRFDRAFSERQSYHGTIFRFELRSTRDKTVFEIRGKLHETEVLAANLDKSSIAELDASHTFNFAHALRTAWLASLSAKADEQSPIPVGVWVEDAR